MSTQSAKEIAAKRYYPRKAPLSNRVDEAFKTNFKSYLATSIADVVSYLKHSDQTDIIAFDLETETLNPSRTDKILGFSISTDPYSGIYLPLRHADPEQNLDPQTAFDAFKRIIFDKDGEPRKQIVVFNAMFELMFLHHLGFDINKIDFQDAQIYYYLLDSNNEHNSLKNAARALLGREVMEYKDAIGKSKTLKDAPLDMVAYYANSDTANTIAVLLYLQQQFTHFSMSNPAWQNIKRIVNLDHKVIKALCSFILTPVSFDSKMAAEMDEEWEKEVEDIEKNLTDLNDGIKINFNSTQQVGEMLLSMGIDTGQRTEKTNKMKVGKGLLEKIDHPVCQMLARRTTLTKFRSMYSKKLKQRSEGRFQYNTTRLATGRFSSGGGKPEKGDENPFYIDMNFQNLAKPKPAMYLIDADKGEPCANKKGEYIIEGYKLTQTNSEFIEKNPDLRYVGGPDVFNLNLRSLITVPDDNREEWYMISTDYSGMELRLGANFSKDPVWLQPLSTGGDVHRSTAEEVFGRANYDSAKRKLAKTLNFGLLYGAGPSTLLNQLPEGYNLDDAKTMYNSFWGAMRVLKAWKDRVIKEAYRNGGYTCTALGRPRYLGHYFNDEDRGIISYGERGVPSHQIQGIGADIMRFSLVRLYTRIFQNPEIPDPLDEIRFIGVVHDEFLFAIRKDRLHHWYPVIKQNTDFTMPEWEIPIETGLAVGYSYGELFEAEYNDGKFEIID